MRYLIIIIGIFISTATAEQSQLNQQYLKEHLRKANENYRLTGKSTDLEDREYDYLLTQLKVKGGSAEIGVKDHANTEDLPYKMGSLNKLKSVTDLQAWVTSKDFPLSTSVAVSPKFDGIALQVVFENGKLIKALTRGDGKSGRDVTAHIRQTALGKTQLAMNFNAIFIGEAVMPLKIFNLRYSKEYKNARNMVAGLLHRKESHTAMTDLHFIAFNAKGTSFNSTIEQWAFCNKHINSLFDYQLKELSLTISDITRKHLDTLVKLEKTYLTDGLVITVNDSNLQKKLGCETNSLNPAFTRAWKPQTQKNCYSEVTAVHWQVSKSGQLKPVVQIRPIKLDGVTITRVTGNNAHFINKNRIAPGAHISIIRAGSVIPKITKVLLPAENDILPHNCPSCLKQVSWNNKKVELVCLNISCPEKTIARNLHFAKTLGIRGVGEGLIRQFYKVGIKDAKSILSLTLDDLLELDGFQQRKAEKIHNAIQKAKSETNPVQLQYASCLFNGLGKSRLKKLAHFNSPKAKPTLEQVTAIKGFSDKSATLYLDSFDAFWQWHSELPL